MLELSKRSQLAVGIALVVLLAMTRGSHFTLVNLASASWAVFFLAGVLLRPRWVFPLLFLQTTFMDVMSVGWANAGHHCMTIAYWALVPAYGALWFGGRLYARVHRDQLRSIPVLAAFVVGSAFVCQVFSSGGFYFFSGRFEEPTLLGLAERLATFYPQYLSTMALYVAAAAAIYIVVRLAVPRSSAQDSRA